MTTTSAPLLFMAGATRKGSLNRRLAHLAFDIAKANGIPGTLIELADYAMPIYDGDSETAEGPPPAAVRLKAEMMRHAGVLVAAPEYNAGITPLLKNTIDWVSRVRDEKEAPLAVFKQRPFALVAASPGGFGGLRGLMQLRQTLELGLGALVLPDQLLVPRAGDAFDEHGHLVDKSQQEHLKAVIQRLAAVAAVRR